MLSTQYTLEKHLCKLGKVNDNCKSLESVYNLQKRKLNRYLSSVMTTFPTYSTHDVFHSVNIISAIEAVLGRKKIKNLSGIDTFLILMCAYMHDVGMLYTEKEVREIWSTDEFGEFLKNIQDKNSELKRAVGLVKGKMETITEEEIWPLKIRQSVTILLMEYYRSKHGARIECVTNTESSCVADLLRVEDSFLPERIIKMINVISMAHTWDFLRMMGRIPKEDSFCGEKFHPRMIAVLLRLGDLCDLDNNRFNKVGIATFGKLGDESLSHYFKHKSIETLYISCEKIRIITDVVKRNIELECRKEWMLSENDDALSDRIEKVFFQTVREHINWKTWLEQEIVDIKLNARDIFSQNWSFQVPEIEYIIKIDGKETVSSNQNLKFTFSTEKAFGLIENISIYQDEKFIFVRELIQNAIDASKIQIWRELCADIGETAKDISPFELKWKYPDIYEKYGINIEVKYNRVNRRAEFRIRDSGIGISILELKENILTTGNSWGKRKRYQLELQLMPEWLRPTGAFGIGLHTVFSVTDQMRILTKSENEEMANEIILFSGKNDGYVFCQKSDKMIRRGSCFSFAFELTEEQERLYLGESSKNEFLLDFENELENKIVDEIKRWCNTPLLPIIMNGKCIVCGLTSSEWTKKLSDESNCNKILNDFVSEDRYLYAFSDDYSGLELWDRKNELVMYVALNETDEINTNFKGIHLKENIFYGSQCYCRVKYLDILAGNSDEMIDASRSKLKYETEGKIKNILKEGMAYAKNLYLYLIKAVELDKQHQEFMEDVFACSEDYLNKKIDKAGVWNYTCELKKKYFMPEDARQVRNLETRIVTYMICLKIVDTVLLKSIQGWDKTNVTKPHLIMQAVDMSAWSLLDSIVCRWKSDWKGNDLQFRRSYFNDQIRMVVNCYLNIWALLIIAYFMNGKRFIDIHMHGQWKTAIEDKFRYEMPFISEWRETRHLYLHILNDVLMNYEGNITGITEGDLIEPALVPVTANVFAEWRYKAAYAKIDSISLEFSKPYAKMLLDIPNNENFISQLEKEVWKQELSKTVYGMLGKNDKGFGNHTSLIELPNFVLSIPKDRFYYNCLPFINLLPITKLEVRQNYKEMTFTFFDYSKQGIYASEETIIDAFCYFWRTVESIDKENNEKFYLDIDGFQKYNLLVLKGNQIEYDSWLGVSWYRYYIPLWDYCLNIEKCLDRYYNKEECVQTVFKSKRFTAVTRYIWKKKQEMGVVVEQEKIRKQYYEFVNDLFEAWFSHMSKG